ncbi:RNA polymerase II C-terminal domain phosphatase-like 4 [Impatiens glandulifera]|uniref:RNA polymerase II C-terminal domain phosphatase-like 4 n=1 Tax=Impatiens glandulifera TaxID=253017 RepID=UPI001FB15E40|nr:RNA polymerase II C-terminal domain phosphatase-like 4 [Impatiens glandulifera]XP_047314315.1 RNA polymerase II C-terminal domain phosphatase-like 4 [Impatiens glandulifera]
MAHSMTSTFHDDHAPIPFSTALVLAVEDHTPPRDLKNRINKSTRGLKRRHFDKDLKHSCDHRVNVGGLCFVCGYQLSSNSSTMTNYADEMIPLKYVLDDFSLTKKEFFLFRCTNYRTNLIEKKKLSLILDLDNTLIHTISFDDFLKEDHTRDSKSLSEKGIVTFKKRKILAKIRPFVTYFLEEVSKLFELYIYTLGSQSYANAFANMFDRDEALFDWRVISRDDCTTKGEKNLDVVLGGEEKAVVIVDDKESVWPKHKDNVIQIKPYYYWQNDKKKTESTEDSINYVNGDDVELLIMLLTLKNLHRSFFDCERIYIHENDVRHEIKCAREYYLKPNHVISKFFDIQTVENQGMKK